MLLNDRLLSSLKLPEDIKKLSINEEKELCKEIREKIISTVSKNGGHLASNLGTVELTVAIHQVFESPKDKIIFDVGHQSYSHKLLTGRLSSFRTLRRKDGLSGFQKPSESEHDPLITGHSSTSISSAVGIAQAMKLSGDHHHTVVVIGDGSLTGGLAYEGLNNAGKSKVNLVIVVNYNEMSISRNIGGIAEYLSKLRIKKSYRDAKHATKKILGKIPLIGTGIVNTISLSKDAIKEKLLHSTLFEDLGFEFIGPVDGHDINELQTALSAAKSLNAPVIVQVNTVKGKGYPPAENNPGNFHSVSSFDIKTGKTPERSYNFTDAMGLALVKEAESDSRICGITAAMKYATGMNYFSKAYPERFFDVGIAEQHAVAFAAGLSRMGMIPVFAVYSSFLQRSYDQLIHDIAIARLHLVIIEFNSGIVGEDGETHQGLFDLPFLSTIPGTVIYSPSCYSEAEICLHMAIHEDSGLTVIRCPKGMENISDGISVQPGYLLYEKNQNKRSDKLIIAYGREAGIAKRVYDKHDTDFLRLLKIRPIDAEISNIINSYKQPYIFEECSYDGSLSQQLSVFCPNLKVCAIEGFVQQMKIDEAIELYGLSENKITEKMGLCHRISNCHDKT